MYSSLVDNNSENNKQKGANKNVFCKNEIWDILQGVNFLGVSFNRNFLAWYDK